MNPWITALMAALANPQNWTNIAKLLQKGGTTLDELNAMVGTNPTGSNLKDPPDPTHT